MRKIVHATQVGWFVWVEEDGRFILYVRRASDCRLVAKCISCPILVVHMKRPSYFSIHFFPPAARFAVIGNFHLIAAHAERKEVTATIDGMRPKEASTDMLGTFSAPRTLLGSCFTISFAQLVLFLRNAQSFSMTSRGRVTQLPQKQHGRLWQWRLARG